MRKSGKVLVWTLLVVLVIVAGLLIFINTSSGKKVVKNRVQSYLQEKLKTKVEIGAVDYRLPEWLELKNVYIEDQQKDTLLYGETLRVNLNMFKLIRGNTDIQKIFLQNIHANISRHHDDSLFNYQFLVDAFSGNKASTVNKDTAEMKMTLDRVILENVTFDFKDSLGGNNMYAGVKNLDIVTKRFRPDRMDFGVDALTGNGVQFFMKTSKMPAATNGLPDTLLKSYPLFVSANTIHLRDVEVQIDNSLTGLYYANKISRLSGTDLLFDMATAKGVADSLLLDSASIVFAAPKKTTASFKNDTLPTAAAPWYFAAKQININNTQVKFDDNNMPAKGGLDFSHLDANNINAVVSGFQYSKQTTAALLSSFSFKDKGGFALDTAHAKFFFSDTLLSATELYLKTPRSLIQKSLWLRYDSVAAITQYPQSTQVVVELDNAIVALNDLYALMPSLDKSLPRAQFANQSFTANTTLQGNLQKLDIPYMQFQGLSGSRFNARGTLHHLTNPQRFAFDLFIDRGYILKKDLAKFVPAENQAQLANLPAIINLRGRLTGNKNDLVANISTSGQGIVFNGKVVLNNISDPKRLQYGFDIANASFTKNLIVGFLPPALLQKLDLPEQVSASGKLSGNTEKLITDLKVNSSYGVATVKGFIKNIKDPQRANYDLYLTTPGFAIGRLIKQDSVLGSVAGKFTAKGTGFDYTTMRSSIKADVTSLEYNKYKYHNALINANLMNGLIASTGKINDNNVKLSYTLDADVRNQYPVFDAELYVDTAQLNKLNFTKDTINLSLHTIVSAKSLRPHSLNATLFADSIKFQTGKDRYQADSISLIASSLNGIDSIVLNAPFTDIHAGGAFDYDKIGPSIQQYISNYYKLPGNQPSLANIPNQQFGIKGTIYPSPLITGFVPGLTNYATINFVGSYASADTDSALNFRATIPRLVYANTVVSNGNMDVNSRNGRINYGVTFDTLTMPTNKLYLTSINGAAVKDSLSFNTLTKDANNNDWFGIAATAYVKNQVYTFFLKDSLLLNYEKWRVAPNNYIAYSPQGLIVNNFVINSDTAQIAARTQQLVPDSPLDIAIDNFNLKSISSFFNRDTISLAGLLDMKATVSDFKKTLPAFTGAATISGLQYMQQPLGDVTANAQKVTDNNIAANLALTGNGNDIAINGNYYLDNTEKQFDAGLQLKRLNVKMAETFSAGQLQRVGGNISGNVKLDGTFAEPRWNGQLNFDTVQFAATQLGTLYRINNQRIAFNYPTIGFNQFSILDSVNHALKINGNITAQNSLEYDLNLRVNADDFILVNAKKTINNQIYGYAAVDVNVTVNGSSTVPDIQGNISLNDKSDVKVVLPQASYAKDDGKTIVRFIDRDTFDINPPPIKLEPEKEAKAAFATFINYNLNINVAKAAAVTIILDPNTGDEVRVQGAANLNAGVDPGGNIVLAGIYELDKGYYDLHYQFLQRKFNLVKGSTITFAGMPLNAVVNITAEYIANTSSKSLLDNEITDVSPTLANSFNQKLPFKVILYLTGPLSKPNINFDVQLPEQSNLLNNDLRTTIENKLQQMRADPAAINKQVFSLLLLNRFVSEQSSDFFKGNGTNFNDIARQSVSQFLSSALNEIANDLVKGVDIDLNFNAYNDFSGGSSTERTDLNVAVSKSFANDRLRVSIGKNFGIEGQDAAAKANATNGNGFKPEISIAYKLTSDGKYMLRAYTKNQFEAVLDGYVVETGLAFVVTMDYNRFRELFGRKRKARKAQNE